jgi:hypothetical protein
MTCLDQDHMEHYWTEADTLPSILDVDPMMTDQKTNVPHGMRDGSWPLPSSCQAILEMPLEL